MESLTLSGESGYREVQDGAERERSRARTNGRSHGEAPVDSTVFRREGAYWTIAYQSDAFRLEHMKGLSCIAHLLRHPGEAFHADHLAVIAERDEAEIPPIQADVPSTLHLTASGLGPAGHGDTRQMVDPRVKLAYQRRLLDLREAVERAMAFNDAASVARAREEIHALRRELGRRLGLRGGQWHAGLAVDRARVNVQRVVKTALEKIARHHVFLAEHLRCSVRVGTVCSYNPDPRVPISWVVVATSRRAA